MADDDDAIKWKHFPRNWPFVLGIHRSPVNSRTKANDAKLWCISLISVWINDWVNIREAGDLRRYRVHYDVVVMTPPWWDEVANRNQCWMMRYIGNRWSHTDCGFLHIDRLVQGRRNSSALAVELRLSCTNPSTCKWYLIFSFLVEKKKWPCLPFYSDLVGSHFESLPFSACRRYFCPPKLTQSFISFRSCWVAFWTSSGAPLLNFTKKTPPYGFRNPMINLRRSDDRFSFKIGVPIPIRPFLLSE